MAHDVFISHATSDKATGDSICAALEKRGVSCWIAPRNISPGKEWGESIIDAIHDCAVFILVYSSAANQSPPIKREVERAASQGIPSTEGVTDEPFFSPDGQWVGLFADDKERLCVQF